MHDVRELLDLGPEAVRRLERRRYALDTAGLEEAHRRRAAALADVSGLRAELKAAARGHGGGRPSDQAREESRRLRERVQRAEAAAHEAETQLSELLLAIPNLPLDQVPDGHSDKEAVEVRRGGPPVTGDGPQRHHADLGEALNILDSSRAARLSGARFTVTRGPGARLERALGDFFLDLHTQEHGYTEHTVPYLVNRQTMTGTGQLPKFEDDLFATRVGDRELFLVPTAEVPLTSLVAGELLPADELPLAFTSRTPCFRAEAGSYGRDTRGILRLHQFEKVELVRVCAAEDAPAQLERMVTHAEECLRRLELSYRVVLLPAGDLGFSARMTYDIEVWLPGSAAFREISSVSDCGTFQARRAGIRVRTPGGGKEAAATLNGSALPVGRTLAALLEQGQRPDGSVELPKALHSYTGFSRILADGSTN
ncbi:serine--tRNA ligase [Streptomyces sp. CHA1]|uniref:serine--tRNA ligase n=1 Tax=Streptomyces TaxID=1883 RepID=UPI00053E7EF9|nr:MULTISPECIES: serine--tRNA ligase [unclassified Streptomyces]MBT3160100.1 serine--tRNA ligase [Streptomyces sp. G11C]MCO6704632.1 serine--tRNA ligase [Streptomyces sp. CHB9.2]MCO6710911.1 serine--tRNA ligase [Streptomyces sp. CHA3]MCO6716682.1 serine--tRNA ligase [Streptomyces sp. CHB19.2]MCO6722822.1 serine--tRNA ligase [Streptomyces sp. Vc714c-19]